MTHNFDLPENVRVRILDMLMNANVVLEQINRLQNRSDWRGGFLCVAHGITGAPHIIFGIGEIEDDRWEDCREYCQEKARRLANHPGHLSSFESRNAEQHQYGGAIRVGNRIFSFSGLPEKLDECMVLMLAYCTDQIDTIDISAIIERSGNDNFNLESLQ